MTVKMVVPVADSRLFCGCIPPLPFSMDQKIRWIISRAVPRRFSAAVARLPGSPAIMGAGVSRRKPSRNGNCRLLGQVAAVHRRISGRNQWITGRGPIEPVARGVQNTWAGTAGTGRQVRRKRHAGTASE